MEGLRERLIRHEGLKKFPYRCPAGKLTIGVGRNIEDVGISTDEALILLDNDIVSCERACRGFKYWPTLDSTRKEVLIEMCFNVGISTLKKFRKMNQAITKKDYDTASAEMLNSQWAKVGKRAKELAYAMRHGEFQLKYK